MKSNFWTVVLLSLASASTAWADVSLPKIFSDGMVLQRQMKVPVWGWGKDGEAFTVEFNGQSKSAVVKDGKWRVDFDPMEAGGPWDMTVKGDNTLTVRDVLVGEVWFTCGQSNMMMGVGGTIGGGEFFNQHQPRSKRCLRVVTAFGDPFLSDTPKDDVFPVRWTEPTPGFSAVSYYFAQKLFEHFGEKVPVGIICVTNVVPAQAWVDAGRIAAHPNLKGVTESPLKVNSKGYNGAVRPIAPYAIRGVVYYQGEYNAGGSLEFRYLMPALIASWREAWEQPAMPFLFVQLPGFLYHDAGKDKKLDMDATTLEKLKHNSKFQWVEFRDVQRWIWQNTPRTGMASAIDLGEKYDIHPRNKMPLGGRLLAWARKLAYGEDVVVSGPYPKSYVVKDGAIVVSYDYVGGGLLAKDGKLDGFEIAGADGQYVPAQARIEGQSVVASSDQIGEPTQLRYAWEGFPQCSLYNKEELPALPFSYSVSGKSFFPDTAQFEFLNPGFKSQKAGKPEGWGTGKVELIAKGGGGFCVRLEPGEGISQGQLARGAGYFWNCPPNTPHFLRPGCLVGYSVDMAVENEGEASSYMNMCSDSNGGGSYTTWNPVYVLKVGNKEFSRYSLTYLIKDQDLSQIVNWKNSVGGRWINQSKTSALLLADFSSVQIVRPLLEISPAIPIQVAAGKASPLIVIRNTQPKTLQKRLAPEQPVEESSTILYGCASFAPDERGLMQNLIEPTDHVGVVLTGKDADKFELVGANADGKSVKLIGNDKKPGLLGGENPESESFSVRLKNGVPPGGYQAAVRIVTQAVNTGVRSAGETNEPHLNLYYTDLLIQAQ